MRDRCVQSMFVNFVSPTVCGMIILGGREALVSSGVLTGTQNCAIKPPVSIVLRDRHRRLCLGCTKAPIGNLTNPVLPPSIALDSDLMRRAVCTCDTAEGVWLCQPCGRSIRGADCDYQAYGVLTTRPFL